MTLQTAPESSAPPNTLRAVCPMGTMCFSREGLTPLLLKVFCKNRAASSESGPGFGCFRKNVFSEQSYLFRRMQYRS